MAPRKETLQHQGLQGFAFTLQFIRKQSGSLARGARDPDDIGRGRELFDCLYRRHAAEGAGPGLRPDGDESGVYAAGDDDYGAIAETSSPRTSFTCSCSVGSVSSYPASRALR